MINVDQKWSVEENDAANLPASSFVKERTTLPTVTQLRKTHWPIFRPETILASFIHFHKEKTFLAPILQFHKRTLHFLNLPFLQDKFSLFILK